MISPEPLETAIAIRAYSERPGREPLGAKPPSADAAPSPWTLVFDCETSIDATQRLRFGFYQVRDGERLHQEGLFYDASAITRAEQGLLRRYAESRSLELLTVEAFRSDVFLKYGYTRGGTVVGFNLPFDISRIAIGHGSARFHMRGGFSFELTRNRDDPRVRVKHLNGHASLIDFAKPGEDEATRGMRKRGLKAADFYVNGLAFLGKTDLHLNLTANACEFFFRSLIAAMKFYGDMREGEGFGSAFERNLGSIFSDRRTVSRLSIWQHRWRALNRDVTSTR